MIKKWVLFVASRYIFKARGNSPVLLILGIAVGVLALIVIIAVMNGFQLSFIESIIEISSYHIRLELFNNEQTQQLRETALSVPGVEAAVPFKEFQALASGRRKGQQTALVRGLPPDAVLQDKKMYNCLDFEDGFFDLSDINSILLGTELARKLGVTSGDRVTLYSITGLFSMEEEDSVLDDFKVTGIFRTGYYEYDYSMAFLNIENKIFNLNECDTIIGIKLSNRFNDKIIADQLQKKMQCYITSWRDYNSSFFGALRTEKLFMFILVGLIFIVVGLNIFQAQRRAVLQRREEIGLLRAVGGTQKSVQSIFIFDGAVIGFTGSFFGLVLGLLIALNIQKFFAIIETIVNSFINLLNMFSGYFGGGWTDSFAIFSPAVFYLKEIPSRILPYEVIIIFLFGFLSSVLAGWFASVRVTKIQPAEVLRYE